MSGGGCLSDVERFIGNGLTGSFGTMLDFYVSREYLEEL